MVHVSLPSSRPAVSVGISVLLAGALALSGCSSTPKKVVAVPTTVAPTTAAVVTPQPFTATGIPAALAAVIKPLYFGGSVPSSPSAAKVLSKRRPVTATGLVVVKGAVSSWKGVPIAVVTSGQRRDSGCGGTQLEGCRRLVAFGRIVRALSGRRASGSARRF